MKIKPVGTCGAKHEAHGTDSSAEQTDFAKCYSIINLMLLFNDNDFTNEGAYKFYISRAEDKFYTFRDENIGGDLI